MAYNKTNPAALTLPAGMTSLANSATAAMQTDAVTTSLTSNITSITAKWVIAVGAITPSASTLVNVYVWGTDDDNSRPGYQAGANEVIAATAGAITLSGFGTSALKFLKSTLCHTASQSVSDEADIVAVLGYIPRKWGLVFVNQTGAPLGTGHSGEYIENYYN
jgi:predicted metal-binding membrane protein